MKLRIYFFLFFIVSFATAQTSIVDSLYQAGYKEFKIGNFDAALIILNQVVAIDSLNSDAFLYAGKCYLEKLNSEKSIEYFEKALKLDVNNYFILPTLALQYESISQIEKAIECHKKYISMRPEFYGGYSNLSFIYYQQKNYFESNKYAREALKRINTNNRVEYFITNYLIALNCYYLNQKKESKKLFIDLLSKDYNVPRQDILKEFGLKNKS
jgi:tetratricopeptide (TPR) repeat protein